MNLVSHISMQRDLCSAGLGKLTDLLGFYCGFVDFRKDLRENWARSFFPRKQGKGSASRDLQIPRVGPELCS